MSRMREADIIELPARLSQLLDLRLRAKGDDLEAKLAHIGRRLPKHVRKSAEILAKAEPLTQNPKLYHQLDFAQMHAAYRNCERYLGPLGRGARRKDFLARFAASAVFVLLLVGFGFAGFLYLKGGP